MQEFLFGAGIVCLYFVVVASAMMTCRYFLKIPDELFRKMLHFVLLFSYIPFVFAFETWWKSALFAIGLEIVIYPILAWAEHFDQFSSFVTERKGGEFKHSLLLAFTMLAVSISVCWGWLQDRCRVLACMYAWGVGDAFAALVGKQFGKHKIRMKLVDPKKSVEGSLTMFVTSALAVLTVLLLRGSLSPAGYLLIPAAGAAATTMVEMITPNGMDTVTCPAAAMAVMLTLLKLMGGLA